jgi:ribonuclease-3
MGLLGLPAMVWAVPARLFQRPPRSKVHVRPLPGATLLELIQGLPPELRRTAFTHSSWAVAHTQSNERLEFLGDSVLGLAIASTLCRLYPESEEGELARLKAFVVSRGSCAQVAQRLGIGSLMLEYAPSAGQKNARAINNSTILGNTLEALIGAVFVTHGFEQARLAILNAFQDQITYGATSYVDHKTALQELLASRGLQPVYRLVTETGPAHARSFTSEVGVDGAVCGHGSGTTIKMSEQAAAKEALASLGGATARS